MKREDEKELSKMFIEVRDKMERWYEYKAGAVGLTAADLIGRTFEYVWQGVEKGIIDFPETKADLVKLMGKKANYLIADAKRDLKRERCGRSVRTQTSIDWETEEGDCLFAVKAAEFEFSKQKDAQEYEYKCSVARRIVDEVFAKVRMSDKNRKIFDACVWDGLPHDVVSKRHAVSRSNVDVIVFRCRKVLAKYGPKVYKRLYDEVA